MERRRFSFSALSFALMGGFGLEVHAALDQTDAAAGARLAMERGANAAVDLLARPDGFLGNPKVRIHCRAY